MAAQERAKQAQQHVPAHPTAAATTEVEDLLSMETATSTMAPPPPPAFDDAFLPPPVQEESPPPFDSMLLPPSFASAPSQPPMMMNFDPHAPALAPPSAPAFEDLMIMDNTVVLPPPFEAPPLPPASQQGLDDETLRVILAMEGLSEADKQELIQEQLKILKDIEAKKPKPQSAADAFESRSFSAAVQAVGNNMQLQGQEHTRAAIADGTAVMVECSSCSNWMQVTGKAQLMFCPNCQTVTPVRGGSAEDAEQMAADLKLAEQLQKEEYEASEQGNSSSSSNRQRASSQPDAAAVKKDQSWMEWLGFGTPAPAPGPARTGDSRVNVTSSANLSAADAEADRLLANRGRVATQQPLFACVTDSISSAAQFAMNASSLPEDEEGNVHGVDSSSLLALPQVGRHKGNNNNDN
jgi:predicted RNA-binding Zn-ribbon protein involved in translation (DUF1610 family)